MSGRPDHNYDLQAALQASELGFVIQPESLDAAYAQYAANGFSPLTAPQLAAVQLSAAQAIEQAFETDVVGVIIPPGANPYPDALPPVFPAGLPRFPDSNEEPFDDWVQYGAQLEGFGYA